MSSEEVLQITVIQSDCNITYYSRVVKPTHISDDFLFCTTQLCDKKINCPNQYPADFFRMKAYIHQSHDD